MKKIWFGLCLMLILSGTVLAVNNNTKTQTIKQCSSFYKHSCLSKSPIIDSTLVQGRNTYDHEEFYLTFDVSSLPKNITITSAIIELFCEERFVADPKKSRLTYERITESWNKNDITAGQKPKTSVKDLITGEWPTPGKTYHIDITPFAQGWYEGAFGNYGIFGGYQLNTAGYAVFTSSNIYPIPMLKRKVNHTPKLTVVYQTK